MNGDDLLNGIGKDIGDLFMAAVFPGVIIGGLYLTYIFILALVKRDAAPVPEGAKAPDWDAVKDVLIAVIPTLMLILAV